MEQGKGYGKTGMCLLKKEKEKESHRDKLQEKN